MRNALRVFRLHALCVLSILCVNSFLSAYGAPSLSLSSDHSVTGIGSRMGFPRFGQLSAYKPVSVEVQMTLRSHSIKRCPPCGRSFEFFRSPPCGGMK